MFKHTIVSDRAQLPAALSWSSTLPVPAVGAQVMVLLDNLGAATVRGYLQQDGYLGLWVQVHNPPAWLLQNTQGDAHRDVFGWQIVLSTTPAEPADDDDDESREYGPYDCDPHDRASLIFDLYPDGEDDGRDPLDIEYDR